MIDLNVGYWHLVDLNNFPNVLCGWFPHCKG